MQRFRWGKLQVGCALLLGTFFAVNDVQSQTVPPRKYAVQLSAQVQESPARIALNWPNEGDAGEYWVSRRTPASGWQQVASLGGDETSYSDANVNVGAKYEYQVIKGTSSGYTGYGYISAGIRVPLAENRGKIILLVENALAGALDAELSRLQTDLIGDGWSVIRRNASAEDSPSAIKESIRSIYYSDPQNVKALFLIGHLPVPYSGNFFPDGHENHQGAWPADSYYADIDGNWTDSTVNNTKAEREANWNTPGDGKFDQSNIPSNVELRVGRVDLSNMTCYSNKANARSELDLMRQYLAKDHAFRFGETQVSQRGLICDNFADKGADPISGSAWRNFSTFFGPNSVTEVGWNGYLPAATQGSYLWSYGSGGGSYYYCSGVATSDDLATNDVHAVFTMWMGSYFGDWNNESNFLRATLGSGNVLTASYSGFPHTLYFPMALGEPIGSAIQLTQNNATNALYPPWNTGSGQVHIALLGDPTLRMKAVRPPLGLNATPAEGGVRLSWTGASEGVLGYYAYRALVPEGPYTRVTADLVTGASYTDLVPSGSYTYMLRTVSLEQSGSGTYLNLSQGIFASGTSSGPVQPPQNPPAAPTLQANAIAFNRVDLQWNDVSGENGFKLERKSAGADWSEVTSLGTSVTSYSDTAVVPSSFYVYRIRAFNDGGLSTFSPEVPVTTSAAPENQASAQFVELDSTTEGNWPARFGAAGFALPSKASTLAGFNISAPVWVWSDSTFDPRAPFLGTNGNSRLAAGWFGETLDCSVTASNLERVAFYFVDWDGIGRDQVITVSDAVTGTVLDSREIAGFGNGVYAVYNLAGKTKVTISRMSGTNAVLSGVFAGLAEAGPISSKPLKLVLQIEGSGLVLQISGDAGQKFQVFSSDDLISWSQVGTGTLQSGTTDVPLPGGFSLRQRYYRTVNYP